MLPVCHNIQGVWFHSQPLPIVLIVYKNILYARKTERLPISKLTSTLVLPRFSSRNTRESGVCSSMFNDIPACPVPWLPRSLPKAILTRLQHMCSEQRPMQDQLRHFLFEYVKNCPCFSFILGTEVLGTCKVDLLQLDVLS
jgi:hypothetical protein